MKGILTIHENTFEQGLGIYGLERISSSLLEAIELINEGRYWKMNEESKDVR